MRALLPILAISLLAACSGSKEPEGDSAADYAQRAGVATASPTVAEVNAQPIVAPTGSAKLAALTPEAPKALGQYKGGCTFAYQGRQILVVRPPVKAGSDIEGLLVIEGQQIILPGSEAADGGVTLAGAGYTVSVSRAAGNERGVAGLKVSGPQGDTIFTPGTWSCAA